MNLFHLLALLSGIFLPVQVALNHRLTAYSGNPIVSSLCSFIIGSLALSLYCALNPSLVQRASLQIWQAPLYLWLGGLIGGFYIVSSLIVTPKIGIAMTVGLVVGGQLCMSVVFDHYGMFGLEVKPFSWVRGLGLCCVLLGILLIKK